MLGKRFGRIRFLFMRGQTSYVGLVYAFISNAIVIWGLFLKNYTNVSLVVFALIFTPAYFIACVLIGRFDTKHTSIYGAEQDATFLNIPYFLKLKEDVEEIKKILKEKEALVLT